jgi:hypothetical protein
MNIDIRGRIKNTKLPTTKPLLPLFEAVINSIQSIEEANNEAGLIEIDIIRDTTQLSAIDANPENQPIINFIIKDNGVGFNELNYQSFDTADTIYKEHKGSKGVGRLIWLKAFNKVEIESTYRESDHSLRKRSFDFLLSQAGTENLNNDLEPDTLNIYTKVSLLNFKEQYRKSCPKTIEAICHKIIEHCFIYFMSKKCPNIILKDSACKKSLNLNAVFEETIQYLSIEKPFYVKDHEFLLTVVRTNSSHPNTIHYFGNDREVRNEPLSQIMPEFNKLLVDENHEAFSIRLIVSGNYLDENINSERTDFTFWKGDDDEIGFDEIKKEEIKSQISVQLEDELSYFLQKIREERDEKIKEYIHNKAPQFRYLYKYKLDEINKINPNNLSDEKLDIALYKIQQKLELEVKHEFKDAMKAIENPEIFFSERAELFNKINEVGHSKLSQYVVHRKLVLDLFGKTLELNDESKYALENAVHNLIFPLKSTSDDLQPDHQNLWIIDEKLSYHKYLASDLPFKSMSEEVEIDSMDRPDLLIFNRPIAVVTDDKPYNSIVIIEFKRPMRNDYKEDNNPIEQVYTYVKKIRGGTALSNKGREIKIPANTPIYCYIICDMTSKLMEQAQNFSLTPTPDQEGFFGYNSNHQSYVEVISFDKLLRDAKLRNRILFDKLNISN